VALKSTTFVDRPEVMETFVDHVRITTWHDNTLRLELCVTRVDDPTPAGELPTAHIYPVARLALTATAGVQLQEMVGKWFAMMEAQGAIQRTPPVPPPMTPPSPTKPN